MTVFTVVGNQTMIMRVVLVVNHSCDPVLEVSVKCGILSSIIAGPISPVARLVVQRWMVFLFERNEVLVPCL